MGIILSIITVNLNNKIGLQKTIESVVNQTFNDYEFIIIDGGSDEGSTKVIKEYEDKITFWCSEKDSGIYNAMNKGISHSNGGYLLFLNSGDSLVNEKVLEKVFNINQDKDILLGNCNIWEKEQIIFTTDFNQNLTLRNFYKSTIPHQSAFIKKSLFEQYGLYDENYKIHGDFEFWLRTIIKQNCTVENLNILITDYNNEGFSTKIENKYISNLEVKRIFSEYIPERVLKDYEFWLHEKKEMKALYWIKSKPIFYSLNKFVYTIAGKISLIRKSISN